MFKVRTYNQISVKGLERFSRQHYEVGSDIGHPDAYLLRSQKLQGVEVPDMIYMETPVVNAATIGSIERPNF